MFAWTSVQAIFATPGVELFRGNKQMRKIGKDYEEKYGRMNGNSISVIVPSKLSEVTDYQI